MPSALTELRIDQFKRGKLELIVTPSEMDSFITFIREELAPVHYEQYGRFVSLLSPQRTCVFCMIPAQQHTGFNDLTHKDILSPVGMDAARIPFALMSDDIPYLAVKPEPPKPKLDDEWGMEKIELRNKIRGIESNFSILTSAMELLKMQIDSLCNATDAKDAL